VIEKRNLKEPRKLFLQVSEPYASILWNHILFRPRISLFGENNVTEQNRDDRTQTKRRLIDKLKLAVGGLVVAAASLSASPVAEASTTPPAQQPSLEERVAQLHQQLDLKLNEQGEASATLAAFNNWGNHWDKWHNWHNWANWHNHH
jgi:hypothetical protein